MASVTDIVKLIKNHGRRWKMIRDFMDRYGPNITQQIELEDIEAEVKSLVDQLERRVQILKEKQAIQGISTDPSTLIEIEDGEKALKEIERLAKGV